MPRFDEYFNDAFTKSAALAADRAFKKWQLKQEKGLKQSEIDTKNNAITADLLTKGFRIVADPTQVPEGSRIETLPNGQQYYFDPELARQTKSYNPLDMMLAGQLSGLGAGFPAGTGNTNPDIRQFRNKKTGKLETLTLVNGKWQKVQ